MRAPLSPEGGGRGAPHKRLQLWFQDEARIGNKGRVCHRWWLRGRRPPGLCDRRYQWSYIFSAVRPATGDDFTLVLPEVSTRATRLYFDAFARSVPDDVHAVVVLDGAGWHQLRQHDLPNSISWSRSRPTAQRSTPSNASGSLCRSGFSRVPTPSSTPAARRGTHSPTSRDD